MSTPDPRERIRVAAEHIRLAALQLTQLEQALPQPEPAEQAKLAPRGTATLESGQTLDISGCRYDTIIAPGGTNGATIVATEPARIGQLTGFPGQRVEKLTVSGPILISCHWGNAVHYIGGDDITFAGVDIRSVQYAVWSSDADNARWSFQGCRIMGPAMQGMVRMYNVAGITFSKCNLIGPRADEQGRVRDAIALYGVSRVSVDGCRLSNAGSIRINGPHDGYNEDGSQLGEPYGGQDIRITGTAIDHAGGVAAIDIHSSRDIAISDTSVKTPLAVPAAFRNCRDYNAVIECNGKNWFEAG